MTLGVSIVVTQHQFPGRYLKGRFRILVSHIVLSAMVMFGCSVQSVQHTRLCQFFHRRGRRRLDLVDCSPPVSLAGLAEPSGVKALGLSGVFSRKDTTEFVFRHLVERIDSAWQT